MIASNGYCKSSSSKVGIVLGTSVGIALPAGATLFALHHFVISPIPQVLLVFFPALLFGWLRETTGSLPAPGLFHAACNVFAVLLTKASAF
jgi:CAAX protease family protein